MVKSQIWLGKQSRFQSPLHQQMFGTNGQKLHKKWVARYSKILLKNLNILNFSKTIPKQEDHN